MNEIYYHTTVRTDENFWLDLLTREILPNTTSRVYEIDGEVIKINSTDSTVEEDIVKLSMKHPLRIFEVTYSIEDPYENLVSTYQYCNGMEKFVKQEYEYCFCIRVADREKLDPSLYGRFQEIVLDHFKKIDNYRIRTRESDPTFKEQPVEIKRGVEKKLVPSVTYLEGDVLLKVTKIGLTYLDVTVTIDGEDKTVDQNQEDGIEYAPLPF